MSDSHDQSYYEIALTNRQVMSIFVVLLICILVSFLGGVLLGRDADASVEMASTRAIEAAGTGEEPLEELDFFTRRNQAAKSEAPNDDRKDALEEKPPEGTKAPPEAVKPKPKPKRKAEPAVVPAPQRVGSGDQETKSQEVVGTAGTGSEGDSGGTSAPAVGPLVIQVFSSTDAAQARRVVDQLRKGGYPAVLSPVEVAGRTLHRVRIGPYSDPDEAKVVAESVSRTFKLETWITR